MPGAASEYTTRLVEGEAAFLEWSARSSRLKEDRTWLIDNALGILW